MQNWIVSFLIGCAACWLLVGCGNDKSSAKSSAAPSTASTETPGNGQPEAAGPQANQAPLAATHNAEADIAATLGLLTQAVRKYSAEKQRVPASLSEVIAAGYVTGMPSPPPGKKFAITRKLEVTLVKE